MTVIYETTKSLFYEFSHNYYANESVASNA
jgi:hypothetical protein